jgi:hypothetical protein
MNRVNLQKLVLIFGLAGLVVVIASFILSLAPARKPQFSHPRIDISELRPGSFIEERLESSRVFILLDFDGQIHAYVVPYRDGAYWLPEFDWSRPAIPCASFGPDNTEGKLDKEGVFRCWLPDYGEFFRREHSWSYTGRKLGYRTADMRATNIEIDQDMVVLLEW